MLISLMLLTTPAGARTAYGQKQAKEEDPSFLKGVRFSVQLIGSARLKPQDVISLKFSFKNTNKSRVYFFKHLGFGPGGFRISILDANNKQVPRKVIAESFPPPLGSKDDFQAIEPGKAFEEPLPIPLQSYEIGPGDYTLTVSFLSPVPDKRDVPSGLLVLTSSDFFRAKPIRFKVLAP